jgi:hypothetical protein
MDFFCRLGGNPICNKLDLNSSNPKISSKPEIGYLQQLYCRNNTIALNKLGWDHTHYNSISPKKGISQLLFPIIKISLTIIGWIQKSYL